MASKADLEVQWLRTVIMPEILKNGKFVTNYNETEADTFKIHDIQINFIGVEEAFMLTTCYRAAIEFEFAGVAGKRVLVVKKTPQLPEAMFDAINFAALFGNEINAYNTIFPALERFTEQSFSIPSFHYGDLQRSFATIVLEDFNVQGWRMSKEKVNLSLEHILLGVKYLANFHGVGFALKHADRSCFDSITSCLKESRYASPTLHPEWELSLKTSVGRISSATKQYEPTVKEEFLQRLTHLISSYYHYGRQRVEPKEPMATLCHGDFLRNNMAYKYEETAKDGEPKPIDVMMFDLQTMRFSSPMIDLSVFLALSTYSEVRHKNFEQIFTTYCKELHAAYAKYTKEAVPDHLSHDSLLKEFIRFLPYSISVCASFLMTLVEPEQMSSEEMLLQRKPDEEVIEQTLTRGGEVVDRELARQAKELYDLSVQHGVDICEGINLELYEKQI